ncbi:MAG: FixH family protein [Campylobacteraceae bacterium]|jgi:hypothetical protein|nr:FixH family protein [Campylobacteraceae bacterium]
MQKRKNRNYWPHGIIISLLLIVCACVYTIVEAVKYPVELDTYYFDSKQNVDRNYDKIKASQEAFDKKYTVFFETNGGRGFTIRTDGDNEVRVVINDKEGKCDIDADVKMLLTRPQTNKYNQNLTFSHTEKCRWFFSTFNIETIGRWQFQAKITIGEDVGFFTHGANAVK